MGVASLGEDGLRIQPTLPAGPGDLLDRGRPVRTTHHVENYGEFRWVLDGGRFGMTQRNGASDRSTKGTCVVRPKVGES